MKIYTKTGDNGMTSIQGGKRLSKSNLRIQAYGAVDEINASLGIVLSKKIDDKLESMLKKIQNELFVTGADLSNPDLSSKDKRVTHVMVEDLEKNIDQIENELEPLTNFIMPGGNEIASFVHMARTITRRAESKVIALDENEKVNDECKKYLNRLSDLLFVIARLINKQNGFEDIIWKP